PFTIRTPSSSSYALFTCFTDSASPPINSCFKPLRLPAPSSTTAFNRLPVSHSVAPPSPSISPPISFPVPTPPQLPSPPPPPRHNAPQIANVDASNDTGANCPMLSSSPNSAYPVPNTSRSTPRCNTSTPFGSPVDPDVYVTYASPSPPAPLESRSTDSRPIS